MQQKTIERKAIADWRHAS